ncbi:hypothetical protein WME90_33745 [Sorangium sp. So ce375]|uniref:hypothetical protein n=1 Tax=Sorangium sp. So ce375 TaxID=3133306 RepID=UPI003F5B2B80
MNRLNCKAAQYLAGASVAAAVLTGAPGRASAQEASGGDTVSVDGKGIVGGALLGGEVVMLTMGAIGVERAWPYLVFGGLGAVGGGVAGYFVEAAEPPAEVPLYMLAGGMALVIPTLVVTLNATAYKPPESDQSEPIRNEPAAEPPQPGINVQITSDAAPFLRRSRWEEPRLGLVDITPRRVALGVPALSLKPLYSQDEMFKFGVAQGHEVRVPVLRASF